MNTIIDTSSVPCNLVISNMQQALKLEDVIAQVKANDPTISDALAKVVAQNQVNEDITAKSVNLPIYGDNTTLTMKPQDQIIIRVQNAREYLYYYMTVTGIDSTRKKFTIAEAVKDEEVSS